LFGRAFDLALQSVVARVKEADELPDDELVDAWVADGLRLAARELSNNVISE
jgi:hypothetical protein